MIPVKKAEMKTITRVTVIIAGVGPWSRLPVRLAKHLKAILIGQSMMIVQAIDKSSM